MRPKTSALLIGVSDYEQHRGAFCNIPGTRKDCDKFSDILQTHFNSEQNFSCQVRMSGLDHVGRGVNKDSLDTCINNYLEDNIDLFLFYFSGHATVGNGTGLSLIVDPSPTT